MTTTPQQTIIRLKRKRNEDPLPTLYLGLNDVPISPTEQDPSKRPKAESTPSIFTLALTVESEEYTNIAKLNPEDLAKQRLSASITSSRPVSSDSDKSKKRSFAEIIDAPKFRMSRKKAKQNNQEDIIIPLDYEVFDAIREMPKSIPVRGEGVPEIRASGIPDEIILSGDPAKDKALNEMLQSYLTVDHDNRTYVNLRDEYVYDIYYRTATSPDTVPTDANFGVLVYESEPELMDDEEEEIRDDEDADSNSEGYYQNSYPDEDEWAGEGWGSEEDEEGYGQLRTRKIAFDSGDELDSISGDESFSYPEESDFV